MHPRHLFALFLWATLASCDPGIQTQTIIEYRADEATAARAALVRMTVIREGLEPLVLERSLSGPDAEASFPLTLPLHPVDDDDTRRFRVVAELLDDTSNVFHRRVTIGGFEDGKRLEVVARLDADCGDMLGCESEQTCVQGECRPACVLPIESEGRPQTPTISCAAYRKRIQVVVTNPDVDIEGMPFLVQVVDPDLAREARPDGGDIAFIDGTGAPLPHQLVDYDGGSGALIAWVSSPVIRPDVETEFFMYFGGASAPAQSDQVWSTFDGVWHLDEESGAAADDSPRDNGTRSSTAPSVPGVVFRARDFPLLGDEEAQADQVLFRIRDDVDGFEFGPEDSFTLSLWALLREDDPSNRIFYAGANDIPGFVMTNQYAYLIDADLTGLLVGPMLAPLGEWTMLTLVFDRVESRSILYMNGRAQGQAVDISDFGSPTPSVGAFIGGTAGCCFIDGSVDEVWVDRTAWSPSRVRATFDNQSNPEGALTLGALEALR